MLGREKAEVTKVRPRFRFRLRYGLRYEPVIHRHHHQGDTQIQIQIHIEIEFQIQIADWDRAEGLANESLDLNASISISGASQM